MNKTEFVRAIADKGGMTIKEAENAYRAFYEAVVDGLNKDGNIALVGFGTFELKHKAAQDRRNPATGEVVHTPACKVPALKVGKAFKALFNN